MTIRIAIAGLGKIARDEHLPAIAADPRFELAAVVTRSGDPAVDVPCFGDVSSMLSVMRDRIDAVTICTPPSVRYPLACEAIDAGVAVLLEKPPSVTLGEIAEIERRARAAGTALYTGWHSQHALGVEGARQALVGQDVTRLHIAWREDVRKWHPGQQWIWQPGGFGVFDPGINALSIATRILPCPLLVAEARLLVPANRQMPIAARIAFVGGDRIAEFDWRVTGGEQWSITVSTSAGATIELSEGGARLCIDGIAQPTAAHREYPSIYARFADLCAARTVEVDAEPLRIAADAFLAGYREMVDAFDD